MAAVQAESSGHVQIYLPAHPATFWCAAGGIDIENGLKMLVFNLLLALERQKGRVVLLPSSQALPCPFRGLGNRQ